VALDAAAGAARTAAAGWWHQCQHSAFVKA
jgi:hypothetical protein